MRRLRRALSLTALAVLGCGRADGDLRVTVDTVGYVRCLAADPPDPRSWRVGSLRLATDSERRLRIDGAPSPARITAFAGPVDAATVRALRRARPSLAVMLGDIGTTPEEVSSTLEALAALGVPVLVVAGGADVHEALSQGFARLGAPARDRVVHASVLRSIRVGAVELVPLAGSPLGRYAVSEGACGFSEGDLEPIREAIGPPPEGALRVLLSWAAPSAVGIARVEAGSPLVARFVERTGARAVVSAWPSEAAGVEGEAQLRVIVVRPLSGPHVIGAEASRTPPGATYLTLDADGLTIAASP